MKSKAIAVLLAFFLGTLGAHNFYLGDNIKGGSKAGLVIIAILMAVVNSADGDCNPLFGLINLGVIIWVFVEVFMILSGKMKDAKGNPLKE